MKNYSKRIEAMMIEHFNSLNEKDKRRYAAVEAQKLGWSGKRYISELFGIDPKTISVGIDELNEGSQTPVDRIRRTGGGRKKITDTTEGIDEVFLKVIGTYTAGDPMQDDVKWTNLTLKEISELMATEGIKASPHVVKQLLEKHRFKKRKLSKKETMKEVEDRDEQFKNIDRLKAEYEASDNPIISIDTKKKEQLGNFYREGKLYTQAEVCVFDHDFSSFGNGPIIPHGLYDYKANTGYVSIGISKDTSEFACDNIKSWWREIGNREYPNATSILLLADGGGSNSSLHYIFKQDLQNLSNEIGVEIRMAHYPPYTSKYNPIEHRLFCHVTRACQGVVFKTVEIVQELIAKTKTTTGLSVIARINNKTYEIGRKVSKDFKENMKILFDLYLGKWNYRAVPQT